MSLLTHLHLHAHTSIINIINYNYNIYGGLNIDSVPKTPSKFSNMKCYIFNKMHDSHITFARKFKL